MGCNDNKVQIFRNTNLRESETLTMVYQSAVKAISWNPLQRGVLATGGFVAACVKIGRSMEFKTKPKQRPKELIRLLVYINLNSLCVSLDCCLQSLETKTLNQVLLS